MRAGSHGEFLGFLSSSQVDINEDGEAAALGPSILELMQPLAASARTFHKYGSQLVATCKPGELLHPDHDPIWSVMTACSINDTCTTSGFSKLHCACCSGKSAAGLKPSIYVFRLLWRSGGLSSHLLLVETQHLQMLAADTFAAERNMRD